MGTDLLRHVARYPDGPAGQSGLRSDDQWRLVSQRTRLDVRAWDRDDVYDVSNRRAQDEARERRNQGGDSS